MGRVEGVPTFVTPGRVPGFGPRRGAFCASCRPLAARWTPERVRGDGV